ncbi:J domain-containing protein [Paraburkholderia phenazinium]|jgi:curved DNA-binding protein CbpA|uniref:DnaJ domain-containing protein n=1 Tax=Paraburkholderia phenazinium TaxID=60549 RepID=A0A1N6FSR5_9BURK|nr:J domain-containing protein [Paraburkholderia phenazinium]SIN98278.1 DnaJ domain-containing protein [Paraburkholderia phenazinium]
MATLYDKLGVQPNATVEEIKRAYRKAAMRWHPDRNAGAEEAARAAFQDIKDAYGILSDAAQRQVYDAVFAEQMREWEAHHQRAERERAEREEAARAAEQAAYAKMVSLAMRYADEGYNRDVVFGVLLGHQCDTSRAAQIADSVLALHASRQQASVPEESSSDEPQQPFEHAASRDAHATAGHGGTLGGLWFQFLNSLRF